MFFHFLSFSLLGAQNLLVFFCFFFLSFFFFFFFFFLCLTIHIATALHLLFPVLLVAVLAEHGGCLSSVDRDRELRIWNEREARRNE